MLPPRTVEDARPYGSQETVILRVQKTANKKAQCFRSGLFEQAAIKICFVMRTSVGIEKASTRELRVEAFNWSEWRDLNSRPLDPQSSALPAAPHPDIDAVSGQPRIKLLEYISIRFRILQE